MKTKTHLVLPQEILEEVDQIAGKKKRSLFIAEAAREKLEQERFLKILDETNPNIGVILHIVQGLKDSFRHIFVDCVSLLRPIQRDVSHPIPYLINNLFHSSLLFI